MLQNVVSVLQLTYLTLQRWRVPCTFLQSSIVSDFSALAWLHHGTFYCSSSCRIVPVFIPGAVRFPAVIGCIVPAQLSCPSIVLLESSFEKLEMNSVAPAHCSAPEAFLPETLRPGCLPLWPTPLSS